MSAVAWMVGNDVCKTFHQAKLQSDFHGHPVVPLYAYKELTDEEIKKIWCDIYDFPNYSCLTDLDYKFCREIIKKGQEK